MTDLQKARGLCLKLCSAAGWLDAYGMPEVVARRCIAAANTIRDLCDEIERLREERDKPIEFTEEQRKRGMEILDDLLAQVFENPQEKEPTNS